MGQHPPAVGHPPHPRPVLRLLVRRLAAASARRGAPWKAPHCGGTEGGGRIRVGGTITSWVPVGGLLGACRPLQCVPVSRSCDRVQLACWRRALGAGPAAGGAGSRSLRGLGWHRSRCQPSPMVRRREVPPVGIPVARRSSCTSCVWVSDPGLESEHLMRATRGAATFPG